jgi:hypothetical protein
VIFRREPLHKKLAREAELDQEETASPVDVGPHWGATGIHGVPRPRRWDAVASADAPGLSGDELHFVALPLADAIEQTIEPPYRAEAVRQGDDVWAVAAHRVEVAEFEADGDEIELVVNQDGRSLTVDGARTFGSVPELEDLGSRDGDAYVVRAKRLDGDLWEVISSAL